MNATRRLLLCLAFGLLALPDAEAQTRPLLQPTERTGTIAPTDEPMVRQSHRVLVDLGQLAAEGPGQLLLPLFDGTTLVLARERQETRSFQGKTVFLWTGRVQGQSGSSAQLVRVGEAVAGSISTPTGKLYRLRYLGAGVHSLDELDPTAFPAESEPGRRGQPPGSGKRDHERETCTTDPPDRIDALVVYTDDARAAAGSTDAIEAWIYLALQETNQGYANSQVIQRLNLVHVAEVSYVETGNEQTDRDRLRDPADGFLDGVHTLRNRYGADVTVMITETAAGCGIAYIMETVSTTFEDSAFAVSRRTCAVGNFTFGHELGHVMGARHDWAVDPTNNSPYPFNHGFVRTVPTDPAVRPWRTIMAYSGTPSSQRQLFWSNPAVRFPLGDPRADPTGTPTAPNWADNHETLNRTAPTVANFRCGSPTTTNVWMKDAWRDTGAEPDPNTSGDPMWQSPYIWVRRSQDTGSVFQHQHENPVTGTTSWVYAKLHNGGATMTHGDLELYWADASSSIDWPSRWNLLARIPVTGFAARSTRVVEATWMAPVPGHYCMVARWVSTADPMTHAETINIGNNSRNNNNIVWRNLNVVGLGGDTPEIVSFLVRVADQDYRTATLVFGPGSTDPAASFLGLGEVTVSFDPVLEAAWVAGGAKGRGFLKIPGGYRLIDPAGAAFENLQLDPSLDGRVWLTFQRLPGTPTRLYRVDAIQLRSPFASPFVPVVGGVSYDINVTPISPLR